MFINLHRFDDVKSSLDSIPSIVGTSEVAELDEQMKPVLVELLNLRAYENKHPVASKAFKWLVDPNRTGDEFTYVIGPLQLHVKKFFKGQDSDEVDCLYKVAFEALAERYPVLEGPWEQAVWLLVWYNFSYCTKRHGSISNHLTVWIIDMIGNPDLCPNPYLRCELTRLLYKMVKLKKDILMPAFEAVLSVCSYLNMDFRYSELLAIFNILEYFIDNHKEFIDEYFKKLNKILHDLKTSRLSSIIHDVTYQTLINVSINALPNASYGFIALMKTITGYAQQAIGADLHNMEGVFYLTSELLNVVVTRFGIGSEEPFDGLAKLSFKELNRLKRAIKDINPNSKALKAANAVHLANFERFLKIILKSNISIYESLPV